MAIMTPFIRQRTKQLLGESPGHGRSHPRRWPSIVERPMRRYPPLNVTANEANFYFGHLLSW